MSTHYLIETHVNPFPNPPVGVRILDANPSSGGTSRMNGGRVIPVPDYISVQDPTDAADLLAKKYAGLLVYYAGYTRLSYDDMLDLANVDLTATPRGMFGGRGEVWLLPLVGRFQTTLITLTGAMPAQVIVTWEAFSVSYTDVKTEPALRQYAEASVGPSNFLCEVTFDNGGHWYATTDGALLNIPLVGQGTNFKLRLTNLSTSRLGVGSWALVY